MEAVKTFLREGSIRIYASHEGWTGKPPVEAYPFQGLAIDVDSYIYPWLGLAKLAASNALVSGEAIPDHHRAGDLKYEGRTSPLGTPTAVLAREGHDMLAAPCGYCGANLQKCKCGRAGEGEE